MPLTSLRRGEAGAAAAAATEPETPVPAAAVARELWLMAAVGGSVVAGHPCYLQQDMHIFVQITPADIKVWYIT